MVITINQLRCAINLFKSPRFNIIRHRPALSKDIDRAELKVIPFESLSALAKLAEGDIKGFADTHIESHICTNLSSLCKDYPYRIKYSIYLDLRSLFLYSECIDVEILFTIVFGDLTRYFEFIEGQRDDILFKCGIIPHTLSKPEVQKVLSSVLGYVGIKIESKYAQDIINDLAFLKNEVTEVILVIPCIDSEVVEVIRYMATELLKNPFTRIFLVTSAPSTYNAKDCGISYREFFTLYIEILDLVEKFDNIYLCFSEANNFEIIVNRATYLSSYSLRLSPKTEFIPIKSYSYVDSYTLKYLRDCLCSSHLIKRRRSSY